MCTYGHIWGLGSTLGVTREVDMDFFRKYSVCRMLVSVVDPQAIPFSGDVEIDNIMYEVHYWVEDGSSTGVPLPGTEAFFREDEKDDDGRENQENTNNEKGEFGKKSDKGSDGVVDGHHASGGENPTSHKQNEGGLAAGSENSEPMHLAAEISTDGDGLKSGAVEAATPTLKAAMAEKMAAIPDVVQSVAAGCKRRSSSTDEHSLARAERLKAERNGGTLQRNLLVSFLGSTPKA
ncbi:uncharacterized protein LOC112901202 [Panicum hallii]|uniref:uncharacterized protein LOC112901202 n=1 Tax=Panicum hallii TaxID=206008 RepID=UPI000DF4EA06|nr:uncharacterized protein LOC112901202 [Panicum hallii]